jgi:organizing structure protein 2
MSPPTQAPSLADSPSPTPTERLSVYVSHARMRTYHGSLWLENHLNGLMTSALHLENNFTTTIASLAPPKESGEQLLPGLIYVLVSTMAGSIISRNRGILLRATTPLAAGVAAGWYFIPVTTRNVGDLVWEGEKRVPGVADAHMQTKGFLEEAWRQSVIHGKVAGDWVDKTVGQGREVVEGWVRKGR